MHRHLLTAALLALAAAARAGTPDISDEINARLARSKSQQAAQAAERAAQAGALAGNFGAGAIGSVNGAPATALGNGCNIAIGNVIEDKRPGAISTSARRETTVIVTGDVIQVGNTCR